MNATEQTTETFAEDESRGGVRAVLKRALAGA